MFKINGSIMPMLIKHMEPMLIKTMQINVSEPNSPEVEDGDASENIKDTPPFKSEIPLPPTG
jgi:hypothetical protein